MLIQFYMTHKPNSSILFSRKSNVLSLFGGISLIQNYEKLLPIKKAFMNLRDCQNMVQAKRLI